MKIEVSDNPLNPWEELQRYEQAQIGALNSGKVGAVATFVGTMRDFNEGDGVTGMELEHYPGMTENHLQQLAEEATDKWGLLDALIIHRVGRLLPNDPIVLVAVWSSHRKESFEACRWLMEALKSKAPFWKKEILESGDSRWVEKNTAGY
ncbi:MAG: molybdenum cofactor biosynthesis protein MoaE [Gammaproteobacteria bacterium]|nr:molybdenum cofactor biosynthesis protein MoaE [Gammaproteobacteria bacterium]